MARKPTATAGRAPAVDRPEFSDTASRRPVVDDSKANDGRKGPPSALEGGQGSEREARANEVKAQSYGVQAHSDEAIGGLKRGAQVLYVTAKSGDEAAAKVRDAHKENYGFSIRGVSPASDPDANSMGAERDAAIMIANAESAGDFPPIQTEANAEVVEKLGKEDIKDLGE